MFDGAGQKFAHLADPINQIKAPLGIYYITGNHETYINIEKALAAIANTAAITLRDELREVDGMQVLGIDYPLPGKPKDMGPVLSKLDKSRPSIVLFHEPKHVDQIKEAGAGLMLSGHTHKGQVWPFGWITRVIYKKLDYGLHQIGDFNIYTTTGVGTWGPPFRTGNRPEIIKITFSGV